MHPPGGTALRALEQMVRAKSPSHRRARCFRRAMRFLLVRRTKQSSEPKTAAARVAPRPGLSLFCHGESGRPWHLYQYEPTLRRRGHPACSEHCRIRRPSGTRRRCQSIWRRISRECSDDLHPRPGRLNRKLLVELLRNVHVAVQPAGTLYGRVERFRVTLQRQLTSRSCETRRNLQISPAGCVEPRRRSESASNVLERCRYEMAIDVDAVMVGEFVG